MDRPLRHDEEYLRRRARVRRRLRGGPVRLHPRRNISTRSFEPRLARTRRRRSDASRRLGGVERRAKHRVRTLLEAVADAGGRGHVADKHRLRRRSRRRSGGRVAEGERREGELEGHDLAFLRRRRRPARSSAVARCVRGTRDGADGPTAPRVSSTGRRLGGGREKSRAGGGPAEGSPEPASRAVAAARGQEARAGGKRRGPPAGAVVGRGSNFSCFGPPPRVKNESFTWLSIHPRTKNVSAHLLLLFSRSEGSRGGGNFARGF